MNVKSQKRFVERACQQALEAHETEFVTYHDALRTAERIYCTNWKTYRQARGFWGARDEERAQRFSLPSGAARKVFDSDADIQQMLASRDKRLPIYRDKLHDILRNHTTRHHTPEFDAVLREFIDFCPKNNPGACAWRASFGKVKCVFPGRDVWALWMCLRDMWEPIQH